MNINYTEEPKIIIITYYQQLSTCNKSDSIEYCLCTHLLLTFLTIVKRYSLKYLVFYQNFLNLQFYEDTNLLKCSYLFRFSAKISQQSQIGNEIRILNSNPNIFLRITSNVPIFMAF